MTVDPSVVEGLTRTQLVTAVADRAELSKSDAKPASVDLRARPLTKAKGALLSVQKARRRLSA
jgi:hypothetical protein